MFWLDEDSKAVRENQTENGVTGPVPIRDADVNFSFRSEEASLKTKSPTNLL